MSRIRDERGELEKALKGYRDSGEIPPAELRMNSIFANIRLESVNIMLKNSIMIDTGMKLLREELSPEEWVKNGLWQDLLDHLTLTHQTLSSIQILESRITTDQVWLHVDDEDTVFGVGFSIWSEEQIQSLPVGTVVRWRDEFGFKIAVHESPGTWCSPGYRNPITPELPAIIIAGPGDEDEFNCLNLVAETRKNFNEE